MACTERVVVGVTCDLAPDERGLERACASRAYSLAVEASGGAGAVAVMLAPTAGCVDAHLGLCDAIVLTGGGDPVMEGYGKETHKEAERVHPDRQAYESALIRAAGEAGMPVLGVCLGMQMMALEAGGDLDQHLPETCATHGLHIGDREHGVRWVAGDGEGVSGVVTSHHHQAVRDAGSMRVIMEAEDGVIEAIDDPKRAFWVGVQWHPERTKDHDLGQGLYDRLVAAAGARRGT